MSSYPQIFVIEKYQEFLKTLAGVGKPDLVDQNYIKKLGYKSSYESQFLSAIKFIGLVENKRGGGPTELWAKLRTNLGEALATGLKVGYVDLFEFYPDAHLRDDEALANFFRGNSDEDAEAVGRMVNAFVAVRDHATFANDGDNSNPDVEEKTDIETSNTENSGVGETAPKANIGTGNANANSVNLNIQLQLPSDASGEIYDKFFAAMKKHGLI